MKIRRLLSPRATIYLGVGVMLFSIQTDLIFPGPSGKAIPATVVKARPDERIVTLNTTNEDRVVALFAPALTA